MDVLEFCETKKRICKNYESDCNNCPIWGFGLCGYDEDVEKIVPIVEKWAIEHPIKTRQSELLKLFPMAKRDGNGVLRICPGENFECDNRDCDKCRKDYWLKEIEQ